MSRTVRSLGLSVVAVSLLSLTACSGDRDKDGKKTGGGKSTAHGQRSPRLGESAPTERGDPASVEVTRPEDAKTEQYQHRVDNPFLLVAAAPRSTFSIDVDTASYSNVRRYLNDGVRPPLDAVKIEELINYFPYSYPEPRGDDPVSLTANLARNPWNEKHLLLRVGLRGRTLDPRNLPQRNLVFLIDTSGSMSPPNRLPLLKESLKLLVRELAARDRVAIVTYAGSAGLALDSTPCTDKGRIIEAIDALGSGGSTYGSGGIQEAYRIAQKHFVPEGVNRVILGTDGDFNVGITSKNELIRLVEEKRQTGVFLTVLGFGMGNLKDATMEALAQHGNGQQAYIDGLDEARKLFVEQGMAQIPIAKDVKLQIEFNPQRVGAYRLIGYENRLLNDQDFKDDKKDAGDIGSGHTVTALYEIVPAGQSINIAGVDPLRYQTPKATEAAKTGEWLTLKMRYKHPKKETSEEVGLSLRAEPVAMENAAEDFRFATSVAAFGMTLRDSPYKGQASLDLAARLASGSLGNDPQGYRAQFLTLIRKAEQLKK